MIRQLNEKDYSIWLEMAEEVEHLFGPMVQNKDFQEGIKSCINKGDSFCTTNSDGIVTGIIAIDRTQNEISWLAVRKQYRGNKTGDILVKKAVDELLDNGNIYVQTFSENAEVGNSARKLYLNNGFTDFNAAGKNPAGIDTVIMVRKAGK